MTHSQHNKEHCICIKSRFGDLEEHICAFLKSCSEQSMHVCSFELYQIPFMFSLKQSIITINRGKPLHSNLLLFNSILNKEFISNLLNFLNIGCLQNFMFYAFSWYYEYVACGLHTANYWHTIYSVIVAFHY